MARAPGLTRKGSAYFYRRRVPDDLRKILGKLEIWVALGTKEHSRACDAARRVAVEVDKQFREARLGKFASQQNAKAALSDAALQVVAKSHLYSLETEALGYRDEVDREDVETEIGCLLDGGEASPHLFNAAQRLVKAQGLPIELPNRPVHGKTGLPIQNTVQFATPPLLRLVDLLRRAEIEHLRRRLDRLDGEGGDVPHDPLFADISSLTPPPRPAKATLTLREAISRFEKDPARAHLSPAAAEKYILPFRAMCEVMGDSRHITDIDRAACAEAFELITRLPSNIKKRPEYRVLPTLREVAAKASTIGDGRLSPSTIRNHAHHISSFFNWCIRKGLLAANPATRMTEAVGSRTSTRRPFTVDELNALIRALPKWAAKSPGQFWTPLIGLFTGMRLGEIVLLTTDDVQVVDGVTCFVLRSTAERRLKTPGAARVVPIHPELSRLGISKHITLIRDQGGGRLFQELHGSSQRQVVDVFQKRFSRLVAKALEVDSPDVSFHSLRHSFRDALREAGVSLDATRALGGWARSGGIEERYGQGTRPSTLARWLAEVKYPGLDLSPLNSCA